MMNKSFTILCLAALLSAFALAGGPAHTKAPKKIGEKCAMCAKEGKMDAKKCAKCAKSGKGECAKCKAKAAKAKAKAH